MSLPNQNIDGTGKIAGLTEHFTQSADESYAHPAAHAGGFGGHPGQGLSSGTSSSTVGHQSGHDSSLLNSGNTSSGLSSNTSNTHNTGLGSGSDGDRQGRVSLTGERNAPEGTAETIRSYGGEHSSSNIAAGTHGTGPPEGGPGGANLFNNELGRPMGHFEDTSRPSGFDQQEMKKDYGSGPNDRHVGGGAALAGAGAAGAAGASSHHGHHGHEHSSNTTSPSSGLTGNNQSSGLHSSSGLGDKTGNSHSHSGLATGGAALGGAGLGAGAASGLSGHSSNQGGNTIADRDVPKTGNPQADNAINQAKNKLDERTDKDGFTDIAGGKDNAPPGLTGRAKVDPDHPESSVIETTKERSKKDAQGRELDSYGKPYDL